MAHHEGEATAIERVMEVLSGHGLEGMAKAVELLMNEAMKLERAGFLGAAPNERTAGRLGHANGFKPKALSTRLGRLGLAIPQVRALPGQEPLSWYPRSLERGLLSERALELAVAEMYVQGGVDAEGHAGDGAAMRARGELGAGLSGDGCCSGSRSPSRRRTSGSRRRSRSTG
jgi:hypothetical protein